MKKIILSILLIFSFSSCSLQSEKNEKPTSNNNENEVKQEIDIEFLKEKLYLWHLELSNIWLSEIPDFPKLMTWTLADEVTSISLMRNKITKIDWEKLSWFLNLKELNLSFNQIKSTDWIQTLENMKILNYIDLQKNWLEDLSWIEKLTQIKELILNFNNVENVSYLKWLNNLENLQIAHNKVSDISELSNLTNLKTLKIEFNKISDISKILDNKEMKLEILTAKFNLLPEEVTDKLYEINIKNIEKEEWEEKLKIVEEYYK